MEQTPEVGKVNNPEIFLGMFSKKSPDTRFWLVETKIWKLWLAGSYWISHIDLDTFDSDVLVRILL